MQRVITLLVVGFVLGCVVDAEARPQRVDQIPNGGQLGCSACHVSSAGGGARNAFGQAVGSGFLSGSGAGASVVWNATLAGMDSDGDGATNGTELGDPDGDGTPTPGAQVTNPGDATSFPQVTNTAPAFATIGAQTVNEGELLSFSITATDEDNDTVTITASNLPTGSTFENGSFNWTPGFDQSGSTTVSFVASDGTDQTTLDVAISIENVARPLTVSSITPSRTLIVQTAGDTVRFSISAESPDQSGLTYSWQINGSDQSETSESLLVTVTDAATDDVVSVSVSDGVDSKSQSWTVTKTLLGDFNGNDSVDFPDFLIFAGAFGKTSADADFNSSVDLNNNGTIDFPDFLAFVSYFGLSR